MLNQLKLILEFGVSDISPCSFTFGRAFHHPPKPPFSWFALVTALVRAIYCLSIMPRPVHKEKLFIKKFLTSFCFCIMEFRKQKNMFCTSATLLCFTQNNIRIIKSNWFHLKFSKYFWNIFNLENIFRMLNNSVYFQNIVVCNEN